MTLNRARLWGIAFTVIGLVLALIVSLTLADQVETGGSLLTGGVIGFLVVAPFLAAGIYQFSRGSAAELEINDEMSAQRDLMDRLRARPHTLAELAVSLSLAEEEITDILKQLHRLDLFHGYVTAQGQVIYVAAETVREMRRCAVCGAAITSAAGAITPCLSCGTLYYT